MLKYDQAWAITGTVNSTSLSVMRLPRQYNANFHVIRDFAAASEQVMRRQEERAKRKT